MATVFLNGTFVPLEEARVGVLDAGLQHSMGLFETMLGGSGVREDGEEGQPWVLLLEEHMARLASSARELGLSSALRAGALADAVVETVRRSRLARARVRATITGGAVNLLSGGGERPEATVLIVASPATAYPRGMLERGVSVAVADARANPLNPMEGHKTLNYWWRLRELTAAGAKQAAEALVFSVTNHLVGGCVSNAFVVKDGEVFTPIARGEEGRSESELREEEARRAEAAGDEEDAFLYASGAGASGAGASSAGSGAEGGKSPAQGERGAFLPSPVLPGVTRGWVMNELAGEGTRAVRRMLSIRDVLDADEVFLTNSSWGVLPVVKVEGKTIGGGAVGEVTRGLVAAWGREVETAAGQ